MMYPVVWSIYSNLRVEELLVFLHLKLAPLDTHLLEATRVNNEYTTSTQAIFKTRCKCSWYTNFSKNVKFKLINTILLHQ